VSAASAVGAAGALPARRYWALAGLVGVGLLGFGAHTLSKSSQPPTSAVAAGSTTELAPTEVASEPTIAAPGAVATQSAAPASSVIDVAIGSAVPTATAVMRPRIAPPKESAAKPKLPRNPYGG
jgi:hypothetical protein